jgi:5'/3'-nucleotidase
LKPKRLVMVTNDDGVNSPGIIALRDALAPHAAVWVVGPEGAQSAAGMSLTFHKPLRVNRIVVHGRAFHAVSGSPADSVMIGVNKTLPRRPDLVVSGINIGDNLTIQDIFASGTVAAAMEAALMGIPSIAFSMEVPERKTFLQGTSHPRFAIPAKIAAELALQVMEDGLPPRVDLLNVNFPWKTELGTKVKITTLEARQYKDYVMERHDPRGRPYYWLWGSRLPAYRADSDVYAVHKERAISVSPLSLNLTPTDKKEMRRFGQSLSSRIEALRQKTNPQT